MLDQVKRLRLRLGLRVAFVGVEQEPALLHEIEEGKFMFVFTSPESTHASNRWRNMLRVTDIKRM